MSDNNEPIYTSQPAWHGVSGIHESMRELNKVITEMETKFIEGFVHNVSRPERKLG